MDRSIDNPTPGPHQRRKGTYHIETWGCQMNVHDSEKLSGSLERQGYTRAGGPRDADVILLNTCSIREKASEKVFSELGRLRKLKNGNPDMILGVCGCVGQQEGEEIFRRAPFVDLVIGPRATASLPALLERARSGEPDVALRVDTAYRRDSIDFPFDDIRREGEAGGKAYVTIVEGCNHHCTFCIVPRTRGQEVCRRMDDILEEVRQLADRGTLEVEFLGQTVNAYRDDAGNGLSELLLAAAGIEGIRRIRFTTSHPAQMTDRLMDAMAEAGPKVVPFLHLPVQSGSSSVLKDMRRGYDRETYLAKVDGLRRRIPGICLGTDVIVGFPTESDADFRATLSLLGEVRFHSCYSFTYSPRPGTLSEAFHDRVDLEEKQARLHELQRFQKGIQAGLNASWVGRKVEVLVEGPSKNDPARLTGRTPESRIVNFTGQAAIGRMAPVLVESASAYALAGRKIGDEA